MNVVPNRPIKKEVRHEFKYDSSVGTNLIKVWDYPGGAEDYEKIKNVKPEKFHKTKVVPILYLRERLINLFDKVEDTLLLDKILTAQKWLPDTSAEPFGLFLDITDLGNKDIKAIRKSSLCQGFYGNFAILSRGERHYSFYKQTVDFFERFDHLVLSQFSADHVPYLLHQIPANEAANKTYLLFSNTDGSGILIKSLSDPEYGGAGGNVDREIDVILLGAFLRTDVPSNAVIIEGGTGDTIIDQFGDGGHVFIETLTPSSKPLYKGEEHDYDRIAEETPENLGRMIVFDIVAGAWDRHAGNYLIHNLEDGRKSCQEIDFGLFDPNYYKPGNWQGRDDEYLASRYASIRGSAPGWDIVRHPLITKIIRRSNRERIQAGIQQAFFQLHLGKRMQWFEANLSDAFCKRIDNFLNINSDLRFSFQMDLSNLDLYDPGI